MFLQLINGCLLALILGAAGFVMGGTLGVLMLAPSEPMGGCGMWVIAAAASGAVPLGILGMFAGFSLGFIL